MIIFTEDKNVDENLFVEHLTGILANINVPCACIGEVKGDSLKILNNGETIYFDNNN